MEQTTEAEVADIVDALLSHPRHRELLYKALAYCAEARDRREVETFITEQPEYVQALQEARTLVRTLEAHRAVLITPVDEEGLPVDDARVEKLRREGWTDEQLEDLVSAHIVASTPAGAAAVVLLDPARRIESCCTTDPDRTPAFVAVLQLCECPSTLADVKEAVAQALPEESAYVAGQRLEASYFIDRLAEAGALVWRDHAWVTTEVGTNYLASL